MWGQEVYDISTPLKERRRLVWKEDVKILEQDVIFHYVSLCFEKQDKIFTGYYSKMLFF